MDPFAEEPTDAVRDWLRLHLVPGVGPRLQSELLARFGSPAEVLAASTAELETVSGIGPKLALVIASHGSAAEAALEWREARSLGVDILLKDDPAYPPNLARVDGPPSVLYRRGTMLPADDLAIAIVGTRHPTAYGEQQAQRLAAGLARAGVTIVSGLARGIDSLAHRAAMEAGGRTFAVTGHGLAKMYPAEHEDLAKAISAQGAVFSEYRLKQSPLAGLFPQRNRIISGLSLGVIVVEAGRGSGALHTARHAVEQNREVLAVPGRIDHDSSLGCLDLIRDGATLIRGVDDVLAALGPLAQPVQVTPEVVVHQPRELQLNEQETQILNAIGAEATSIDEILRGVDLEASRVLATLTILEMKRAIRRLPGNMLTRAVG